MTFVNPLPTVALSACLLFAAGCAAQETALTRTASPVGASDTQENDTPQDAVPGLLDPSLATKTAPDQFKVKFKTTQGDFIIQVNREWAPNGADRFYNMVDVGYFNDVVIFRAVEGFMFQFGIHGNPKIANEWKDANIKDDPFKETSNLPNTISFAQTGRPNSRSSQMFINLGNNAFLDTQSVPFVPFGKVVEGVEVIKKINTQYGENEREDQGRFLAEGNEFILKKYPKLDVIKSAEFVK